MSLTLSVLVPDMGFFAASMSQKWLFFNFSNQYCPASLARQARGTLFTDH